MDYAGEGKDLWMTIEVGGCRRLNSSAEVTYRRAKYKMLT
jgi:hypothetical protein